MFADYFTNHQLLSSDRLAKLTELPEWDCQPQAVQLKQALRDLFERNEELLHNNPAEPQTKYYIISAVLHSLGFIYSINETVPIQDDTEVHVDFALFSTAEEFGEVEPTRGSATFFRPAPALCQATNWGEDLDLSDDPEISAQQPVLLMDLFLRTTGVDYGIATNGQHWRLMSRTSPDPISRYVETDLLKLLDGPIEAFQYLYLLFSRDSMTLDDEGNCFLNTLMAE